MELSLKRAYFPHGTNGALFCNDQFVCFTIELPWQENRRNISCIPEGKYSLGKRFTERRGWHLLVKDVPNRSEILFHPANNALKELQGCIAPVTMLSGIGSGTDSRKADNKLNKLVVEAIQNDESVFLIIQKALL
ncbi:MAG: DUF5675 family protein [Prolixibacteraceae bacterium]